MARVELSREAKKSLKKMPGRNRALVEEALAEMGDDSYPKGKHNVRKMELGGYLSLWVNTSLRVSYVPIRDKEGVIFRVLNVGEREGVYRRRSQPKPGRAAKD